ncbi:MAG: hypothetical protein EBR82_38130 [Caulobacteraceae bacterium]|nr:hypothetical protein [Caulobacteraceae bacterium]
MTTEVSVKDKAHRPPVQSGGVVQALIPKDLDQAHRLAQALAAAGDMVPKSYQGKPMETMAAILRGMEVGLNPMQALSSIAVINGRATIWGDALPALVLRAGHHVDVEYDGQGDALMAKATLTRGDTGKVIIRTFSMADAKRAGLLAKAWAIRDGAADALMGLQVSDEAQDYGPDAARDVTPAKAAPRRGGIVYAQPAPVAEAQPVIDEIIDGTAQAETIPQTEAEIDAAMERAQADFFAAQNQ